MGNITTVLFDLGGVLVELGSVSGMMASSPYDHEKIRQNWLQSPAVRQFESGQSSADVFARRVIGEFQLQVSPEEFLGEFLKWPVGVYPGAIELLSSLSSRFRLACLSNTNQVHWDGFLRHLELMDFFEMVFMSHETGRLKPDLNAFQGALDALGVAPDETLFFDDNPVNVTAALKLGIRAEHVREPSGVNLALKALGLKKN